MGTESAKHVNTARVERDSKKRPMWGGYLCSGDPQKWGAEGFRGRKPPGHPQPPGVLQRPSLQLTEDHK